MTEEYLPRYVRPLLRTIESLETDLENARHQLKSVGQAYDERCAAHSHFLETIKKLTDSRNAWKEIACGAGHCAQEATNEKVDALMSSEESRDG